MKQPRLYRRLASAHQFGIAKGGWLSLHLAPDHLLLRKSSGFIETYRRFYFADIEAITVCQTVRGIFWNAGFALALFISVVTALRTPPPHVASGIFAAAFTILLVLNVARGTTCRTQLQTRVQTERLPLRRVPKAVRVITQLSPKIQAAQANIVTAAPAPANPLPYAAPPASMPAAPPPLTSEVDESPAPGAVHVITFAVLMLAGVIAIVAGLRHQLLLTYAVLAFVLINVGLAIAALIKQRARRRAGLVGAAIWTSLLAHAFAVPLTYTIFVGVWAVQRAPPRPQMAPAQPTFREFIWLPGFDYTLACYGGCCLVLGLIGCIALAADPSRQSHPVPP